MNNSTPKNNCSLYIKIFTLFFSFLLVCTNSYGHVTIDTPGAYNLTIPTGVTTIAVNTWGAGEDDKRSTSYGGGVSAGSTVNSGSELLSIGENSISESRSDSNPRSENTPFGIVGNGRVTNTAFDPCPTASISGNATVCRNATPPIITFTNPQTYAVTITYNINGGSNQTINVNANSTNTVNVPTTTAGTFAYNLVSVANTTVLPYCTSPISGTATVRVVGGSVSSPNILLNGQPLSSPCPNSTINISTTEQSGIYSYSWSVPASWTIISGQGTNSIMVTTGASGGFVGIAYSSSPCISSSGSRSQSVSMQTPVTPTFTVQPGASTCINTDVTYTTQSGNTNYDWTATGTLGTDYTITSGGLGPNNNTVTLRWLTAGSKTVTVNYTSNCSVNSPATNTTTVNPILTTPTVGTITHPDCKTTTGTVVLNELPSSGTWDLYKTGVATPIVTGGSGATYIVTGLAAGTHTFTVNNSTGCTSGATANVQINPAVINTWNGSAWSNVTAPTSLQTIIFDGNYNSSANVDGCRCEVKAGRTVVFNAPHTLKITHDILVDPTGTLSFGSGASLVQINDTPSPSNSGKITYNRSSTPILMTDYVYWSAPVSGFTLGGIVPGTLYYSYNASANSWSGESGSTTMGAAVGYIVRGGGTWFDSGTTTVSAAFTGAPHNGLVNATSGGAGKTTLTGNPYASALNADAFIIANSAVLDGALYFWTHNTAIQLASGITNGSQGSGKYAYTSDDYATYTLTGGVGTGVGGASDSGSSNIPDGNIATGVAFFADGKGAGGTIIFNNSMRLGSGGSALSNSQMFKPGSSIKTAKTTTTNIEKNRVWLNLTNTQGAFKQTLIGYVSGATNSYDSGYDAVSYDGNTFIDFYSVNEDQPLTIQGRSLPFQETDTVPLGYNTTISGEFTIGIQQTDGVFKTQEVFLEDKLTNSYTNLKETNYTFSTDAGTYNNRFTINYLDKVILGNDTFSTIGNGVVVFNKNKLISIQSSEELISKVQVFDFSGKLILDKTNINNLETTLTNLNSPDQVLILKIVLESGRTISTKIIY